MKKALAYLRRSKKSDGSTVSLLEQMRQVERYCSDKGFELVDSIEDDGVSGAKRERWPRIRNKLIELGATVLVVYNQDRLARDNVGLIENLRQWATESIQVHEVGTGLMDIASPVPKLMLQMRGAFDEFYRDVIRVKTTDALRYRKDNKQRYTREAPFGWQWVEGKMVEHPWEQRALGVIRQNRHLGARRLTRLISQPGYDGRLALGTIHRAKHRLQCEDEEKL